MNVQPGSKPNTVRLPDGSTASVPSDWSLLPPGDAALTRRVKAAGKHWVVQEKKGRRIFSRGVWAPTVTIDQIRNALTVERAQPGHAKRQAAARARRDRQQAAYVEDFEMAVRSFLQFHAKYKTMERSLAKKVAAHATPVGSGTVARTKRIPIESRAEAAVIAWMRHQTTSYDDMRIPRIKGKRREVRRMLAQRSKQLLDCYRSGSSANSHCPLAKALTTSMT